ncbi:ATP-binding protein [Algiphilus sp. W345]|uniref:histidine kinase n=1 Tax=Banduia mediterranea TaxID=3075609 RepID=A0ABU2WHT2_9GAMM|nr:ATP-binding protein [Algiphilus sp. W345]MDT0497435.1 ATP-binding protein [Algiphilus sp. W345]
MARRSFSVEGRLAALLMAVYACGALTAVLFATLLGEERWSLLLSLGFGLPLALLIARQAIQPAAKLLRALQSAVASYRDGDFSVSITNDRNDELGRLVAVHNELGSTLREQRQHLVQRELMLDTVVQNTPVALVLTEHSGRIAYANLAARKLFNDGRSIGGLAFSSLLDKLPEVVRDAVASGEDGLFTVAIEGIDETFHVSRRGFRLQGRPHRLYLMRRMTRELSRQEVATWKKVIRVISHELNNSLAPISSMAHSGAELARRGDTARLPQVFGSIRERTRHLHGFIDGYARFAKLPVPQLARLDWAEFMDTLAGQVSFTLDGGLPETPVWLDRTQIEQVLINLIKNAHESGGAADQVRVSVQRVADEFRVDIADRGSGMSEAVLANALLPFYSTKRSGTGLGLALAREIVEAHGGRIHLSNRSGGGLRVRLALPAAAREPLA